MLDPFRRGAFRAPLLSEDDFETLLTLSGGVSPTSDLICSAGLELANSSFPPRYFLACMEILLVGCLDLLLEYLFSAGDSSAVFSMVLCRIELCPEQMRNVNFN